MRILSDPHFEASPRSDRRGWVALVTWGHALRHEIDGAIFNCENEALQWIAENSPQWLARQNVAESRAAAPKATVSRKVKVPTRCARPASDQSPGVHSSLRARPRAELVRPVPEGPQPQLLGDAGSSRCRRCFAVLLRPRTTTSSRTDCGGRLPLLMKAEVAAPLALRTMSMPSTYLSRPSTRATLFLHAQGRRSPRHSGHRKAIWPGFGGMRSSHSSFAPDVSPPQHLARGHASWHNQALLERGNCNATAAR